MSATVCFHGVTSINAKTEHHSGTDWVDIDFNDHEGNTLFAMALFPDKSMPVAFIGEIAKALNEVSHKYQHREPEEARDYSAINEDIPF